MKKTDSEQEMLKEFAEFIEAEPITPSMQTDNSVLRMIEKDLRPRLWKVYGKMTLIEVASGLMTLSICPQFGMGFGQESKLFNSLHSETPLIVFYLLCGLFFVTLGASLCGLLLNRAEIQTLGKSKYLYFLIYSVLAYLTFIVLGTEIFITSSLIWMLGAILGNTLGFESVIRLRHATT